LDISGQTYLKSLLKGRILKVKRVTKMEFELVNGDVFPINPPLTEEQTPEEFQEHYDRACNLMRSLQGAGGSCTDASEVGCVGEDKDHTD
jgi:hypothetical protein